MGLKQNKDLKLYYSIREVAQQFGVNESTLRYWEKEFDVISPRKTKKGTRFYSKADIEQIQLIYHLLKERGMTIAGARQKLKENKDLAVNQEAVSSKLQEIRGELVSLMSALNELDAKRKK